MKRILSLVLAVMMLASCAAILTACPKKCENHVDANHDYFCDNCDALVETYEYTYNTYTSDLPAKWNPHTYETANESTILDYTTVGFLTFDYNDTMDGFTVVPEMAAKMPEDVTSEYVDEIWDIEEGDEARAWKITLRDDLRWQDGTPITAHDFVTSAQLLLNPKANNHRADSLYEGEMSIVGAREYFYSGKTVDLDNYDGNGGFIVPLDTLVKGDDGVYRQENGRPVHFVLNSALSWLNGRTLKYYVDGYTSQAKDEKGNPVVDADGNAVLVNSMFDLDAWNKIKALADEDGFVPVTDESMALMTAIISYSEAWGEGPGYEGCYTYYETAYDIFDDFDKVGVKAVSDTELVLIITDPLSGFYLHYNLTGSWLVHEETYNNNVSYTTNELGETVYNCSYGTSVDTYMSYGPYKLTYFQTDKQFVVERNDQWYGYSDPAYAGQYQTTKVVYDMIKDPETAMLAFLKGQLDAKGLDAKQMEEYGSSEHLYYSDGASTFFVAMNPDETAFAEWEKTNEGKDKSILGIKEFRMALSFSLDRAAFCLACDPTGSTAFAVFNSQICSDPENGTMYRTTEVAKDVMLEFWGVDADDIGAGKLYADKDEAIASITGYNIDAAKDLFNQAYDAVIAAGLMSENDVVEICIGQPNPEAHFYSAGYEFLKNCWTEAVKGTKLEGKLTFVADGTIGDAFSDALKSNQVNLLFGVGWQGSSLNPYNLMMAYTTPNYQYDVNAWNTAVETMDFEIDGVTYRATINDWTYIMMGEKRDMYVVGEDGEITGDPISYSCGLNDKKPEERLRLFGALEGAVLRTYDLLPLNNDSSAALKGMQIKYYTEEEVYGLGRGGIRYMTYNYTDAQWAKFVRDNNGTLNYK